MQSSTIAFDAAELEHAAALVHAVVPPTPQYPWPKLARRAGCTVWVKHENHTPTGAFKVRGGLVYLDRLRASHREVAGVITATRGNHGQSIAFAATFADGLGTREPHPEAIATICRGAARMVQVSEDAIAEAMRIYFDDTHQVAEGAGAAPLAALLEERTRMAGKTVAVVLSGGNIARARFQRVLGGETPPAA